MNAELKLELEPKLNWLQLSTSATSVGYSAGKIAQRSSSYMSSFSCLEITTQVFP